MISFNLSPIPGCSCITLRMRTSPLPQSFPCQPVKNSLNLTLRDRCHAALSALKKTAGHYGVSVGRSEAGRGLSVCGVWMRRALVRLVYKGWFFSPPQKSALVPPLLKRERGKYTSLVLTSFLFNFPPTLQIINALVTLALELGQLCQMAVPETPFVW